MGRKHREKPTDKDVVLGMKYLRSFQSILQPLRLLPAHGNRRFFMDQYVSLLLLHFYNPVLNCLRSLDEATDLDGIRNLVGVKHTSLGSMSESAAKVFRAEHLIPIIEQLSAQVARIPPQRLDSLPGVPTAVDGTFLRCLPKMVWALFRKKSTKRGVKLHLHYDITRGIPAAFEITPALGSEKKSLRKLLESGRLYLTDRGYIDYKLYQAIHDAGSFFVSRLKDNSSHEFLQDRPLTQADRQAGVVSDQYVRMGSAFTEGHLTAPVRRVAVGPADGGNGVILLTNTDLPAELVALLYRYRWQVELFFRWFKCILGCRNWLSLSESGLTLQVYVALLASILLALWTGMKPSRSLFRVLSLHFMGWASDANVEMFIQRHRKQLAAKAAKKAAKNST